MTFNNKRHLVRLSKWAEKHKTELGAFGEFLFFFVCVRYLIRRACLLTRV